METSPAVPPTKRTAVSGVIIMKASGRDTTAASTEKDVERNDCMVSVSHDELCPEWISSASLPDIRLRVEYSDS